MPVPSGYTEQTLAVYMKSVLGGLHKDLGWDVQPDGPGSFQLPVDDTLVAYGVNTIAEATDVPKLRALARWQVWRAVYDAVAGHFDINADGQGLTLSQVPANVAKRLDTAHQEAMQYLPSYRLQTTPVRHKDPYTIVTTESEWG